MNFSRAGLLLAVTMQVLLAQGQAVADQVGQMLLLPERDVHITSSSAPLWKARWDKARELARSAKYAEALRQYQGVLTLKGNIDEARWEYANLLAFLEQWPGAARQLDVLLARRPDDRNGQLARAKVAYHMGDTARAVRLYGWLYESDPAGKASVAPLTGLIDALEAAGRYQHMLPLMEQLRNRRPRDPELAKRLAQIASSQGKEERARQVLLEVLAERADDPTVLRELAHCEQALGNSGQAAAYWRRVLEHSPRNSEALRQLAINRRLAGDTAGELTYLERLVDLLPEDVDLLLRTANLNMHRGRTDRALVQYSSARKLKPQDPIIKAMQQAARVRLARELLTLVEVVGAEQLWVDLEEITADRIPVYQAMADLLRQQGKTVELTAVLRILNRPGPKSERLGEERVLFLDGQAAIHDAAGAVLRQ